LYKNKKRLAFSEAFSILLEFIFTYFVKTISTLLLLALPAEFIFVSIGLVSPNPEALSLDEETFRELK
jgi:hypothetical protein